MINKKTILELAREFTKTELRTRMELAEIESCPTTSCRDCRRLFPKTPLDNCPCHVYSEKYLKRCLAYAKRILKEEGLL